MENNIIENVNVQNVIQENTTTENMLVEVEKKQEEINRTVASIDQNLFIYVLIATVIILMIFEGILNYFKAKKETENKENSEKYKKKIRITLIVYFVYLIIYFLIIHFALQFPTEIVITFMVVSTIIMYTDVFVELPFLKRFKKK